MNTRSSPRKYPRRVTMTGGLKTTGLEGCYSDDDSVDGGIDEDTDSFVDEEEDGASIADDSSTVTDTRNYQDKQYTLDKWEAKYKQLCKFREAKGDCLVPTRYAPNPSLANWVKSQRMQNKRRTLKDKRVQKLEEIGFLWNPRDAKWEACFKELKHLKEQHGGCNVPQMYKGDRRLRKWVNRQRSAFKGRRGGDGLTLERIKKLESLGFKWERTCDGGYTKALKTATWAEQDDDVSDEAEESDKDGEESEEDGEDDGQPVSSGASRKAQVDSESARKPTPSPQKRASVPAARKTRRPASQPSELEPGTDDSADLRVRKKARTRTLQTPSQGSQRMERDADDSTKDSGDHCARSSSCVATGPAASSPKQPAAVSEVASRGRVARRESAIQVGNETGQGRQSAQAPGRETGARRVTKESLLVSLKAFKSSGLTSPEAVRHIWDVGALIRHLELGTTSVQGPNHANLDQADLEWEGDDHTATTKPEPILQLKAYTLILLKSKIPLERDQLLDCVLLTNHLQNGTVSWRP